MKKGIKIFIFLSALYMIAACAKIDDKQQAEDTINKTDLERHVITLASDEFMGRQPFTIGEEKTIAYLADEFEKMGLEPANNGSYFQDVPMVEITFNPTKKIHLKAKKGNVELNFIDDFIASTSHVKELVEIKDSEMVFAGYGIVAPEFGWNDYEGLDVKGKTVLVLVNDPGFTTQDSELFRGNSMTYYGRWAYKFEEAARQGATGVWVIHNTAAAGYGWQVLTNTAENKLFIQSEDGNIGNSPLNGWITEEAFSRLAEKSGYDAEELKKYALDKDFKAVELGVKLNVELQNNLKFDITKNVMAMIPGTDLADECIVYTAHWDHFGVGPVMNGDSIYNGAVDNGIPVACMLETAKAFANLKEKPRRSVLFVAVTAEETGMLGSKYYVENAHFAPNKTVANLNYELFIPMGLMKDVTITGKGQSELDNYVEAAAKEQDRYIIEEPFPENGMYYRSDHFSFARAGIPSLFIKGWTESREHGTEWVKEQINKYWATGYHKPGDHYDTKTADPAGNVEDAKLFFKIGYQIANETYFPMWNEGSEFRAIRDASMK